jgi:mannose-1-phosphate guanylyltransferase
MAKENNYIIILCGGTGPRLWPLSRSNHPKQFLKLFSPNSLLKETVLRSLQIVDKKNIFITTNQKYYPQIKKDLGQLIDNKNIFCEPEKKNTSQAIIFSLSQISHLNQNASVCFLPSDHNIPTLTKFSHDIKLAFDIASKLDSLITIGLKPTFANPSFGYIIPDKKKNNFFTIKKFIEKPTVPEAQKLINNHSFWNSGIYIGKISIFIKEFSKHQPEFIPLYQQLISHPSSPNLINKIYKLAPNIAFDKAISEKSKNLLMIPATFLWNDVGEWRSILSTHQKKPGQNLILNPNTLSLNQQSENCLISSENPNKLIGFVGLKDIAIIDTPDALLVCNLHHSEHVRDLVSQITANPKLIKYFSPDEKK